VIASVAESFTSKGHAAFRLADFTSKGITQCTKS